MKTRPKLFFLSAIMLIIANGCSLTRGSIGHSIQTQVHLSSNNFKVVGSVTGDAMAASIFGIGVNQKNLTDQARRNMIEKANLAGTSKAIINVTTDVRSTWFLIWESKTIYVSGEIVEFTK